MLSDVIVSIATTFYMYKLLLFICLLDLTSKSLNFYLHCFLFFTFMLNALKYFHLVSIPLIQVLTETTLSLNSFPNALHSKTYFQAPENLCCAVFNPALQLIAQLMEIMTLALSVATVTKPKSLPTLNYVHNYTHSLGVGMWEKGSPFIPSCSQNLLLIH